ncbi:hypothetical protein [Brevibacterium sp. VCM10]|nr:hypothetical protein [Brevibacterium sp. VCM10]
MTTNGRAATARHRRAAMTRREQNALNALNEQKAQSEHKLAVDTQQALR